MNKKKKIFIIILIIVLVLIALIYLGKKIYVNNIKSNSDYLGEIYSYTYYNKNVHHDKIYYRFYYKKDNNKIICVKNNFKIIDINNSNDLNLLYDREICSISIDKAKAYKAYDKNGNELENLIAFTEEIFP